MSPKVSVVTITYNHEKFIEQAVYSALMQATDFEVEIIIGDDCSTDRTREIITALQKQHPDRIRLLLQPKNVGVMPNFVETLKLARGEYIALLDGDDYWTEPHKLGIQVNYLDNHPECSLCFHSVAVYSQATGQVTHIEQQITGGRQLRDGETYALNDLLGLDLHPRTCSIMYRSSAVALPEWSRAITSGDTAVLFLAAQAGMLGFIDQTMATYRLHEAGVWTGTSKLARQVEIITTLENLNRHFRFAYAKEFKLREKYMWLARLYQRSGEPSKARRTFRTGAFHPHGGSPALSKVVGAAVEIYAPRLYRLVHRLKGRPARPG